MDAYAIARRIEQAGENDVKNVCIRFYSLHNGKDIWVSGEAFNNAGGMAQYLEEVVGLDEDVIKQLCDRDHEVVATEGDCLDLCFKNKVFDWSLFGEITCALEEYHSDIIRAAIGCGVPLSELDDKFVGQYGSFEDFVKARYDELYLDEIPDYSKGFIDYGAVKVDWEAGGQYSYENGCVFDLHA